jgi:hypothetical protein
MVLQSQMDKDVGVPLIREGRKDGGVYLVVSASLEEESDNTLVTSLDSEVERCPVRRIARRALDVDTALKQQLDALLWIHKI